MYKSLIHRTVQIPELNKVFGPYTQGYVGFENVVCDVYKNHRCEGGYYGAFDSHDDVGYGDKWMTWGAKQFLVNGTEYLASISCGSLDQA